MKHANFFQALDTCQLVPVLNLDDVSVAGFLAEALWEGGVKVVKVTLRTHTDLSVISNMKSAVPSLKVGAGTILSSQGRDDALAAGSDFLVTPATSTSLAKTLLDVEVPVFPGVATPSEAMNLYEQGFEDFNFFPAEGNGGVSALHSMSNPLPHIRVFATGGITEESFMNYLAVKTVVAVDGSFMIDQAALETGNWKRIASIARLYCEMAKQSN